MAEFEEDLKSLLASFQVPEPVQKKLKEGSNPCLKLLQFAEYVDDVKDWIAFFLLRTGSCDYGSHANCVRPACLQGS